MNGFKPAGGFDYWVSDEQLAAFSKLSTLERLQWVEQARLFTLATQTAATARRHEQLRKGETEAFNEHESRQADTDRH